MQTRAKEIPMKNVRRTDVPEPEPIHEGLDALVDSWIGRWKSRKVHSNRLWERAQTCQRAYNSEIKELHPNALRVQLNEKHLELRRLGNRWAESFEAALPVIVGAAKHTLKIEPYCSQMMGALALAGATLTEMATGEGKTLTIALAAVAAGWSGRPVHIITANDYLAQRDAKTLHALYEYCGLTVASVTSQMKSEERRAAYRASVVYCTGKELVADFLRDRILLGDFAYAPRRNVEAMKGYISQRLAVLRGIHIAFVDEADNQLIDEAVTPLIISRSDENSNIEVSTLAAYRVANTILEESDYQLNLRHKEVRMNDSAREKISEWCADKDGMLGASEWMIDLVKTALQAKHFFVRGKQYVVQEDALVIVDEFTGRLMPGRSWRLGLHQAVEAKEKLDISMPSETLARLSFQRFYRLFRHLAGITGTAREAALEFWRVYRLPFIVVPRHKPNKRVDNPPYIYATDTAKRNALVEEVIRVSLEGRPVLVGTRSVAVSEQIAEMLRTQNIDCMILNAARHADEAQIISMAGREGLVTIATNMAGRGTDILIDKRVEKLGGLHVVLSEPHESPRVDRQLMGRAGRQGELGTTSLYVSTEDEVIQRSLSKFVNKYYAFRYRHNVNKPGRGKRMLKSAQRKAERKGLIRRMIVLRQDAEMGKQLMNRSLDRI
jgi:preprotein translocase subunit SecA